MLVEGGCCRVERAFDTEPSVGGSICNTALVTRSSKTFLRVLVDKTSPK